ncbi:MAG: trypsin-like serine protease [Sandaracinaceae bacterium]|nr:trypsin-like serine protease [Sandaracinaceae bacterium]
MSSSRVSFGSCALLLVASAMLGACNESITVDAGIEFDAATLEVDAGPSEVDAGPTGPDSGFPECGPDERTSRLVYYGTQEPTLLPLTPGQILAVVDFGFCSGTFVTDEWVLTAKHCSIAVGARLCVGPDPLNANVCFTADRVESHPSADITLVHVDAPASSRIPELIPIPLNTETLDASWIGRMVEAAGYGTQEDGSSGEREFTAEPIVELSGNLVTIDGGGTHGVCFGDSGGPLMALASDATVRVIGGLFFGDMSCVGQDNFTRVDLYLDYIEAIIGPIVVEGAPCGRITEAGDCVGARTAVWCDTASGTLTTATCDAPTACGWDAGVSGFRCVTDDPCEGVGAAGACVDGTASWCDAGTLRHRGCSACGELCRYVTEVGGFYCRPDPCIGIDPMGECDGTILTECDPETGISVEDCADRGRVCGFSTRRNANRCIRG